jgi:hypothetical protein
MLTKPTVAGGVLAVLAGATLFASAQGPGLDVKGQVKAGVFKTKLEGGTLYRIEAEGKGFRPRVVIGDGFGAQYYLQNFDKKDVYTGYAMLRKSQEYRVIVVPDVLDPIGEGALDFTLKFTPLSMAEKPVLNVTDKWTDQDPLYQPRRDSYFKAYPIKLKAGRFYIIDLVKKSNLDPYLYIENDKKDVVMSDDDSGGDLNARIVFRPEKDGEYRIIATTLTKAQGGFELTVRSEKGE